MIKILVTGGAGQVGQAFLATEQEQITVLDRHQLNIANQQSIHGALQQYQPNVVINAAAFTNVEQAEIDPESAFAINSEAAGLLAKACLESDVQLIQLSTDYVFDGTKGEPYAESDETKPINNYGHSKLAGELKTQSINPDTIVVRTSWLYSEFCENFQTKLLRAAKDKLRKKETLKVVSDEFGTPTYAPDLIRFLLSLSDCYTNYKGRILHFASGHIMSRLALAQQIISAAVARGELAKPPLIEAVFADDYPSLANRPKNSALKNCKLSC